MHYLLKHQPEQDMYQLPALRCVDRALTEMVHLPSVMVTVPAPPGTLDIAAPAGKA